MTEAGCFVVETERNLVKASQVARRLQDLLGHEKIVRLHFEPYSACVWIEVDGIGRLGTTDHTPGNEILCRDVEALARELYLTLKMDRGEV